MKIKNLILPLCFCFTLLASHAISAEELKTITLKDGSVLKGKIISMSGGTYTIKTALLDEVEISEAVIANIGSSQINPANSQNSGLKGQVEKIQTQVLQNPAIMSDIQKMLENPEMLEIMKDQDFITDIMSMDPARIQNNPKAQQLLGNPQMQEMMKKIEANIQE
ncbi:MAG: hypothetical protein ACI9F2_000293 [Lysobacterales bacterium]|jgi:hypothetical protein